MQLNEILEENTIKGISEKTKISEDNLENLFTLNFDNLPKIKALGFISIIEREYKADLKGLKEEAKAFYSEHGEANGFGVRLPVDEESKGKSKLFLIVVLALLGYASWYFFTQFDKKHLSRLIPFMDEQVIESFVSDNKEQKKQISIEELSIENAVNKETKTNTQVDAIFLQEMNQSVETVVEEQNISIVPVGKLMFDLIDAETKEKEHLSIDQAYKLDINTKTWLIATTSSTPFSLIVSDDIQAFDDAKEHYFKIDKNGIQTLSKDEYAKQGEWNQW